MNIRIPAPLPWPSRIWTASPGSRWCSETYHVTNVREDGTNPRVEPKSWELFNTFRTNIQIEKGSLCRPIPVV